MEWFEILRIVAMSAQWGVALNHCVKEVQERGVSCCNVGLITKCYTLHMSLDHIGFGVKSFAASRSFYEQALAPLGYAWIGSGEGWGFLGKNGKGELWIGEIGTVATPVHLAFTAPNRAAVDAFYTAALAAGGKDNGAPGIREQYHPNYYAAFVIDPDGHNVEVVSHQAE